MAGCQDYFYCLLEVAFHDNGSLRSSENDVVRLSLEKICVNVLFVMRRGCFPTWSDSGRVVEAATRISVVARRVEEKFQAKRVRREYREIHVHLSQILGHVLRRVDSGAREAFFVGHPWARKACELAEANRE